MVQRGMLEWEVLALLHAETVMEENNSWLIKWKKEQLLTVKISYLLLFV